LKSITVKKDLLAGNWRARDEWSDIEYCVSGREPRYRVNVRDFKDGEKPDVFEIKWHAAKHTLSFAAHWNSTGRFMRCRLRAISPSQVDLTYTYTETVALARHSKKNA
jgi:hypothetical protein